MSSDYQPMSLILNTDGFESKRSVQEDAPSSSGGHANIECLKADMKTAARFDASDVRT